MPSVSNTAQKIASSSLDERGFRILAKSMLRELRKGGHSSSDIVAFTNAVLEMLGDDIAQARDAR